MDKISNQDIERHYFEQFCSYYSLPSGKIMYGDAPDVILEGERRIGIEITNFFLKNGSSIESRQVQSKWRQDILAKAQQIYLNNGGRKFEISFGFNEDYPIRKKKDLENKIADLANRIEGFKSGRINRDIYDTIPELSFVYLNNEEYQEPKWRVVQVYVGMPGLSRERLVEIVVEKEKRSEKYSKCDEYWLLVVIDFIDRSQDQDIQIDGFNGIETDIFKKIIVYKTAINHILEAK